MSNACIDDIKPLTYTIALRVRSVCSLSLVKLHLLLRHGSFGLRMLLMDDLQQVFRQNFCSSDHSFIRTTASVSQSVA